jgi:hypothetical protein
MSFGPAVTNCISNTAETVAISRCEEELERETLREKMEAKPAKFVSGLGAHARVHERGDPAKEGPRKGSTFRSEAYTL